MNIEEKLKEQIKENDILIYMKGTPYEPRCGFSARTVQTLIAVSYTHLTLPTIYSV